MDNILTGSVARLFNDLLAAPIYENRLVPDQLSRTVHISRCAQKSRQWNKVLPIFLRVAVQKGN